jgi:hypothetical protein
LIVATAICGNPCNELLGTVLGQCLVATAYAHAIGVGLPILTSCSDMKTVEYSRRIAFAVGNNESAEQADGGF